MKEYILVIFSLLSVCSIYSQLDQKEKEYFQWFDDLTDAKNSDLSNGMSYIEKYITKRGHHEYYETENFLIGNLVYNGQFYFNVNLQYNLYSDQLILRFYKNDDLRTIMLIKDKVEKFTINKKKFIKIDDRRSNQFGYYEALFENETLNIFKKHLKKRQRHLNEELVYYSFYKKSNYLIHYQNKYEQINTKKSIIKLFPKKKKLINNFFSNKNHLLNNSKDQFLKLLFQQIIANG